MNLSGDYHTHTTYSHGKNTVLENAISAAEKNIGEIAISDHGFSHLAFGLRRGKLPALKSDCKAATEKTGVNVLVGIEANLRGECGLTCLKESDYDDFDVFLLGVHICVAYASVKDVFNYAIPNVLRSKLGMQPNDRLIRTTTNAYVNAIRKYPIDVITHLNFMCFADAVEVAKAARDYGTYIELNSKKTHLTDEELAAVRDTGVKFIISSDAHESYRVGDTAIVDGQLSRVHIPRSQIVNIDGKKPDFRFSNYKNQ